MKKSKTYCFLIVSTAKISLRQNEVSTKKNKSIQFYNFPKTRIAGCCAQNVPTIFIKKIEKTLLIFFTLVSFLVGGMIREL